MFFSLYSKPNNHIQAIEHIKHDVVTIVNEYQLISKYKNNKTGTIDAKKAIEKVLIIVSLI
jgi:hypothetical protein